MHHDFSKLLFSSTRFKYSCLSHHLSIPDADAEQWRLDNWRTNFNSSMHPPELMSFHVYNLTNLNDVLAGATPIVEGAIPFLILNALSVCESVGSNPPIKSTTLHALIWAELGPYVYRVYREKYAIDRVPDADEVLYEMTKSFVFQPDLSKPGLRLVG